MSLDLTWSTARCASSSRSTTSTVPRNVIDIAPILTLISALASAGLSRSTTFPPSTHGMMRSRSRIASQLYSVALPVLNEWSSSTMALPHRRDRRDQRVDRDLDDVGHLERAEQRRERLHLPIGLLDHRAARQPPVVADVERELDRVADPHQLELALHVEAAALHRDRVRAEADREALEH